MTDSAKASASARTISIPSSSASGSSSSTSYSIERRTFTAGSLVTGRADLTIRGHFRSPVQPSSHRGAARLEQRAELLEVATRRLVVALDQRAGISSAAANAFASCSVTGSGGRVVAGASFSCTAALRQNSDCWPLR